MTQAQLWRPRAQRVKAIHVWRERRACFGEMVMQDSSPFRWLEERGPACALIAVIDDASSRLWARMVEHDTTEENLRTLGGWLQRYGRPLAHYTDKNSIFRHRSGVAALQEQLRAATVRHFTDGYVPGGSPALLLKGISEHRARLVDLKGSPVAQRENDSRGI
jgi:hypothetical protein